ncbi:hypothetical protein AVEN_10432-1 [Araneus ventricosus]|uniref:Uncharacterized protein n=1 Tax=Araneus ventricosus TaxID=182803 RepID=A0A4Y2MQ89_ARAVE|nr:hypothetical protein AVEN_216051-1 [Araneus ventricosus]GBN29768.1 hypothetical protein AVEN_10432-1 [Araneus ventricosus]
MSIHAKTRPSDRRYPNELKELSTYRSDLTPSDISLGCSDTLYDFLRTRTSGKGWKSDFPTNRKPSGRECAKCRAKRMENEGDCIEK